VGNGGFIAIETNFFDKINQTVAGGGACSE
jgi:hypothetical protein